MNEKLVSKKNKFLYLIIAGFLGTLAFYVAAYVDREVTGVPLDITVVLGQLVAGEHESAQIIGHAFHIGNGIGLTLFFGYVFLPVSQHLKILFHSLAVASLPVRVPFIKKSMISLSFISFISKCHLEF